MKRCSIIAPAYHIAHDPCESEGEKRETRQVFFMPRTCSCNVLFISDDVACMFACNVVFK